MNFNRWNVFGEWLTAPVISNSQAWMVSIGYGNLLAYRRELYVLISERPIHVVSELVQACTNSQKGYIGVLQNRTGLFYFVVGVVQNVIRGCHC